MSTATDLLAAADYIEVHGWTQGDYFDEDGKVCAVGAIQAVCPGDPQRRVAAKVRLRAHLGGALIIGWNDNEDRTQAEVVAALRAAASAPDALKVEP